MHFFQPKFQMCLNIIQPMVCYPFVRVHALKIKNSGADMPYTVYQNMMHDRKAQRPVTFSCHPFYSITGCPLFVIINLFMVN